MRLGTITVWIKIIKCLCAKGHQKERKKCQENVNIFAFQVMDRYLSYVNRRKDIDKMSNHYNNALLGSITKVTVFIQAQQLNCKH